MGLGSPGRERVRSRQIVGVDVGVSTGDWLRVKEELGFYRATSYHFSLVFSNLEALEFASLGLLV